MSPPPPKAKSSDAERSEAGAATSASRCDNCGGRLGILVRVEPQANGQPVTYHACDRCGQVLVRRS